MQPPLIKVPIIEARRKSRSLRRSHPMETALSWPHPLGALMPRNIISRCLQLNGSEIFRADSTPVSRYTLHCVFHVAPRAADRAQLTGDTATRSRSPPSGVGLSAQHGLARRGAALAGGAPGFRRRNPARPAPLRLRLSNREIAPSAGTTHHPIRHLGSRGARAVEIKGCLLRSGRAASCARLCARKLKGSPSRYPAFDSSTARPSISSAYQLLPHDRQQPAASILGMDMLAL